jgi:mannitol/fructose-specific phosphotransferase system IIA component (Ntr-type)
VYIAFFPDQVRGARVLLTELLTEDRVKVPLGSRTKDDVLRELVELAASGRNSGAVDAMLAAVRDREEVLSTGIGGGVAIPHGKTPHVEQLVLAAGVSTQAIDFDALDGQPVHLFFLLLGPESASGAHVKALSRISRLLRRNQLRHDLLGAASPAAFLDVIRRSEAA